MLQTHLFSFRDEQSYILIVPERADKDLHRKFEENGDLGRVCSQKVPEGLEGTSLGGPSAGWGLRSRTPEADLDVGVAASSLQGNPGRALLDLGGFLLDHVALNTVQGPDNTGEMTD